MDHTPAAELSALTQLMHRLSSISSMTFLPDSSLICESLPK
jgi:hypothetical protein